MRPAWLVPLALLAFTSLAHGAATIRLGWDTCDNLAVDRSWSGPGSYALELSGVGFSGSNRSMYAHLLFAPFQVAPAWDFSTINYWTGQPGCQSPSRLTATNLGSGCPAYPATYLESHMEEGSLTGPGRTVLIAQSNLNINFSPDPAQRYALLRLVFDHSQSVAGPSGTGTCGQVEEPMCVSVALLGLSTADNHAVSYTFERSFVTWQDPANITNCPGATPAQAKTWGAIKSQYR